jgi:hemoglobin
LDYLSAATGGPTLYLGQDMKTAHEGLGISASDWQIAMDYVQRAMRKFKLPDKESKELMAVVFSVADQIIER